MKDYEKEWVKAEMPEGKEPEIPLIGHSVALYLCPHDRNGCWEADLGSLYMAAEDEGGEADVPYWGSAFGIYSGFDGVKFEDILKDYEVCFAAVPPLEYGRFPAPLGIPREPRGGIPRAVIKRIPDRIGTAQESTK